MPMTVVLVVLATLLACSSGPSDGPALPGPEPGRAIEPVRPAIIPERAGAYRKALLREVAFYWPGDMAATPVLFGQVHQESLWRPEAESRFAAGLTQFTPDTARWIQGLYPQEFRELCGAAAGCPMDARWALRAMVLYDRRLWRGYDYASERDERFAFMLASYNGGSGWIVRERRYCQESGECRPDIYFGQVQAACGRSTPARSSASCKENREYPQKILFRWRPAYRSWLGLG